MKSVSSNFGQKGSSLFPPGTKFLTKKPYCAVRIFRWKSQKIHEGRSIRRNKKTQRLVSQTEQERDGYCYRAFRYVTWRYRREAGKKSVEGLDWAGIKVFL